MRVFFYNIFKNASSRVYLRPDYLLLLVIICASAYVRLAPVFTGDFPFLFDHGRDMLAVKRIVVDHKLTLLGPFTGLSGLYHGAIHYYMLAIPFVLTGGHPAGGIVFLTTLFLIGIGICYFAGKYYFSRSFGLLLALFFGLATGSVAMTVHVWNPYWIPFFTILLLFLLYGGIFKNPKLIPFAGFVAGLITQFEFAFGMVLVPTLFVLFVVFMPRFYKSKYVLFAFVLYLLTFTPQLAFDIRHDFLMSRSIVQFISGRNTSLGEAIPFKTRLVYRVDEIQKATTRTISGQEFFRTSFLIFVVLGSVFIFFNGKQEEKRTVLFLLLIPLVYFTFFLFYPRSAWEWYWVGLQVVYYFLVAYILSYLFRLNSSTSKVVFILVIPWVAVTYFSYFGNPEVTRKEPGTFSNMLRVVDTTFKDSKGKPFGVFVYTPPIYSYAYDYVYWWRGTTKYKYVPNQSKDGLFYLVIEPNKERPWEIEGWKKTKIVTGTVKWTKTFPGSITVEKRTGTLYD